MKSFVITGASGFIGKKLVSKLLGNKNIKIKILSRQGAEHHDFPDEVDVIKGDLLDKETLGDYLDSDCVVINLVYLWNAGLETNLEAIKNLVNACNKAGVEQLIHCSTAAVVGRANENYITENTACKPVTEYGITKFKVEQEILKLTDKNYALAILRPTSVFGPGGAPLKKLTNDLKNGSYFFNYLKSCLFSNRRMNLVHIDNVIASMLFLIDNPEMTNREVLIISDDDCDDNNFEYIENRIIEHINKKKYFLPRIKIASSVLRMILFFLGRNAIEPSCNYSSQKILEMGFERPVTFENGMAEYLDWRFPVSSSN